jgi:small subunit ribosomal protein S18
MAKKREQRAPRGKDAAKRGSGKKKPCIFCKEHIDWVDYKDVNLLRRFMSDRAKIRARRVTGNCTQHQRDVAIAIKTARELALLPYATRVATSRGGGRGGGRPRRDEGRDMPDRSPVEEETTLPVTEELDGGGTEDVADVPDVADVAGDAEENGDMEDEA